MLTNHKVFKLNWLVIIIAWLQPTQFQFLSVLGHCNIQWSTLQNRSHLEVGLQQLGEADERVAGMKGELEQLRPEIQRKTEVSLSTSRLLPPQAFIMVMFTACSLWLQHHKKQVVYYTPTLHSFSYIHGLKGYSLMIRLYSPRHLALYILQWKNLWKKRTGLWDGEEVTSKLWGLGLS